MGGPYSMSKHALEAYNDTLAPEMARFDVGVSAIEPGNYKSDISMSASSRMDHRRVGQGTGRMERTPALQL